MKKIVLAFFLVAITFYGCQNETYNPELHKVQVGFSFDKFVTSTSPMAAARMNVNWKHDLSSNEAEVTVEATGLVNEVQTFTTTFKELPDLTLDLVVGADYTIRIKEGAHDWYALVFSAESESFTATASMSSIPMACSTSQALVLIEKQGHSNSTSPHFELAPDDQPEFYTQGKYWYLYGSPDYASYSFHAYDKNNDRRTFSLDLLSETIYVVMINPNANGRLDFDYNDIWNDVLIEI